MKLKYLITIILILGISFIISTKVCAKYIKEKTLQIATIDIKAEHTYTVNIYYTNKNDGTVLESTKLEKLKTGQEYKSNAIKINDFYLDSDSGNTEGTINNEDVEVYYYYKPYGVYAKTFDTTYDGKGDTLILNSTPLFTYTGTLINDFNNEDNNEYQKTSNINKPIWYNELSQVKKVEVLNEIRPKDYTSRWFELASNISEINNISNIKTNNIKTMEFMFRGCKKLKILDLSSFNTEKVQNMRGLFYECKLLEKLNISSFDTKNVTSMKLMFADCQNLQSIDTSNFNTRNVTNMEKMFFYCSNMEKIDLLSFDTAKVTTMNSMFTQCNKVKIMDLSSFNTTNVTDMYGMFYECKNLETIYISQNWKTSKVTKSNYMFRGDQNLTGNMGTIYDESKIDKDYAHSDEGPLNPGYMTLKNNNN